MDSGKRLRLLTLNIHKGFSSFNARLVIDGLRDAIRDVQPAIVFLQEVVGLNVKHAEQVEDWPENSQYEYLAKEVWENYTYGKNAVYPAGHHGNAILSKFPIVRSEQVDISASPLEQRGLLYAELSDPEGGESIHCVCVHLGLFGRWRKEQYAVLRDYIGRTIPPQGALIIAGDFNDWSLKAERLFAQPLGVEEVFDLQHGRHARTYPVWCPVLRTDRIYVRGFEVRHTEVCAKGKWRTLSDHAALTAEVELAKTGS